MIGDKITLHGEEWEEIGEEEYKRLSVDTHKTAYQRFGRIKTYYKKVQKLPLIFENESGCKIKVFKDIIMIDHQSLNANFASYESLPLLIKAVDAYKALQEKK